MEYFGLQSGEVLRRLRGSRKVAEVARVAGVASRCWFRWERQFEPRIPLEQFSEVIAALGCTWLDVLRVSLELTAEGLESGRAMVSQLGSELSPEAMQTAEAMSQELGEGVAAHVRLVAEVEERIEKEITRVVTDFRSKFAGLKMQVARIEQQAGWMQQELRFLVEQNRVH